MSGPIANVYSLGHFPLWNNADILPHCTSLLHCAFSMSKGTVTTDSSNVTHVLQLYFTLTENITCCQGNITLVPVTFVQYVP